MERAVLKDLSVGCADDSLKLLVGKIIGCKAINLIFKWGFNFEKEQCKNATFVLNSPFLFAFKFRGLTFTALPKVIFFCFLTPIIFGGSLCDSKDQ